MRRTRVILSFSMALLFLVATMMIAKDKDPSPPASNAVTVGEFALKVVRLAGDEPATGSTLTAEEALAALSRAGLHFRGSPGDQVTEAEKSAFYLAVAGGLLDRIATPPSGFDDCSSLGTVGECRACCLALPGATNKSCGRACGRAHADNQHASPSEPTP